MCSSDLINRKGAENLKIKLESAELPETEVIIRGDVTSEEVVSLLQLLKKRNSGKLILYKEEEQYIMDADFYIYDLISIHDVLFFLFVEDQFSTIAFFQKLQKRNHFLTCHIAPDDDFGFRQFRRFQFDFQILSPFPVRP